MLLNHGAPVNAINKNHQTAYMLAYHQGNIDAMCALLNAGADPSITSNDDGDANDQYMDELLDDGCSTDVTLQTIMLNPAWQYVDFPELEITGSLSFNLVSCSIFHVMRHVICSKR